MDGTAGMDALAGKKERPAASQPDAHTQAEVKQKEEQK
jgi:hypothetical protein